MQLLHATVTADAQVVSGECYFVGAELSHTGDTVCIFYNENSSSKTAAQKMLTLKSTDENQWVGITFPLPGIKCSGIYADWTAGLATVWYYR